MNEARDEGVTRNQGAHPVASSLQQRERSVKKRALASIAALILSLSAGSPAAGPPQAGRRGHLNLIARWGDRTGQKERSVRVRIKVLQGARLAASATLDRPPDGEAASHSGLDLSTGDYDVVALAYEDFGPSARAARAGRWHIDVEEGRTITVLVAPDAAVSSIEISPPDPAIRVGKTHRLTATARDQSGVFALSPAGGIVWDSSAPAVARVDRHGTVTGVAAGTAIITATEVESGKRAAVVARVTRFGTISFAAPRTYAVPRAGVLTVADFDGDHHQDVVVASNNSVLIFYGRGDGTLEAPVTLISTDHSIAPWAVADMDGNGKPDIVCTEAPDKIAIFFNAGRRTFTQPVRYTLEGRTVGVCAGDLNGDHRPDIAVLLYGGAVAVLLNQGGGVLGPPHSFGTGQSGDNCVLGDLDRDGNLDLVVGSAVYIGDGKGGFKPGGPLDVHPGHVPSPTLADLNRDSLPDVILDAYWEHQIVVCLNQGSGRFSPHATYPAAPYPFFTRTADFDGDGYPDIVTANAGTSYCSILRNRGDGTFEPGRKVETGGSNTRTLAIADFNNDGKPDIIVGHESSGDISILLNATP